MTITANEGGNVTVLAANGGAIVEVKFDWAGVPSVFIEVPNGHIAEWPRQVAQCSIRMPDGREARSWLSLAVKNAEHTHPTCRAIMLTQRGGKDGPSGDVTKRSNAAFITYKVGGES